MKRLLLFFLCISWMSAISAQQYVVYTIVGKPTILTKKGARVLKLRDKVTPSSIVNIPYGAKLELFDEASRKQLIIKIPGNSSVASMLKDNRNSIVTLTDRYFRYILSQVQGNNETIIRSCSDPATIAREEQIDSTIFVKEVE